MRAGPAGCMHPAAGRCMHRPDKSSYASPREKRARKPIPTP